MIPRVHVNFQRGPLTGQIGIAQVPVVQGVRVEPEHGGSMGPSVEQICGRSHVGAAAG